MSENVVSFPHKPLLKVSGVGRDAENECSVSIYFSRRLTDGELRFFHEVCERSASLMDGEQ